MGSRLRGNDALRDQAAGITLPLGLSTSPRLCAKQKTATPLPRAPRLGYQRATHPSRKARHLLFYTLFEIVGYLINLVVTLVIVQFVLSLLIAFNVVNMHNDFVAAIWRAVNALLDPIIQPIRRFMPHTGAIDFSPMVLIVILQIVPIVLRNLALSAM